MLEVSMKDVIRHIHRKSRIPVDVIVRVLQFEEEYLIQEGIIVEIDEEDN
ncbi:MAG: hypothetical protein ACRDDY_17135 [Clostridium sp.]